MEKTLHKLFNFLKENHAHNRAVQYASIKSSLLPFLDSKSKIKSLLMDVAVTQSKPKLDLLVSLWKAIDEENKPLDSAQNLVDLLSGLIYIKNLPPLQETHLANQIFFYLRQVPGFGEKTAALFVKSLVMAHLKDSTLGFSDEKLPFLTDAEKLTSPDGIRLYLPVDSVIRHIFSKHLGHIPHANRTPKVAFESINKLIFQFMDANSIPALESIYWDDLWYWGFITQRGSGANRETKFNESKYMSLKSSNSGALNMIRDTAERGFINQILVAQS